MTQETKILSAKSLEALPQILLQDTAKRLGRMGIPGQVDLGLFGARPRLGHILDQLNVARAPLQTDHYAVGLYLFMPVDSLLALGERTIRLTEKERDILLALLKAPNHRIDRKAMLDQVWGYASDVETHTLETHIYRLRQKMEEDPAKPAILVTEGDGYRLV